VPGWTKTFFYVKNTVPAHQATFGPFSTSRLIAQKDRLTSRAGSAEVGEDKALQAKVAIICRRGLRFHTLIEAWMSERIIPLSPCPRLLHTYTGRTDDLLRAYERPWTKAKFITAMKKMVRDKITEVDVGGLPPSGRTMTTMP
jgi:hypothetical protein